MKEIIRKIDYFGGNVSLSYKGNNGVRTIFGGIVTIFNGILLITYNTYIHVWYKLL